MRNLPNFSRDELSDCIINNCTGTFTSKSDLRQTADSAANEFYNMIYRRGNDVPKLKNKNRARRKL